MSLFHNKHTSLWVFLLGFFICWFGIGSSIIYILDEAKNSEAAREMLLSGNFFRPTFNNVVRTDKPPFHYFFMMLGYKLFGVNAFGARFFSAIFGGFTIISTYIYSRRHLGDEVAKITFWILISSFYFVQEFHLAVPDPYLIFWMSLTFFSYIDYYIKREKHTLWILYISVGFGVLTKGPVALVLPSLIASVHLILLKELTIKAVLEFKFIPGIVLVLLISVPWFYFAHLATDGAFTEGFFFKHNLSRFQNKMEGHGGIFLITIGFVLLGMFPFSFWIFRALIQSLKQKKENAFVFFGGLVVLIFIIFFAISSTKLPNYTMPCYPFLAVLLGWYFKIIALPKIKEGNYKAKSVEWFLLILISVALPVAAYIGLSLEKQSDHKGWVGLLIVFVPIGVVVAYVQFLKQKIKESFKFLVGTFALLSMVLFGIAFPVLTKETPIEKYKEIVGFERPVVVFQRLDAAFPINFNRTYKVVESLEEVRLFFEKHPKGVVMTNLRNKEKLEILNMYKEILSQKSLFENHTTRVYKKSSE